MVVVGTTPVTTTSTNDKSSTTPTSSKENATNNKYEDKHYTRFQSVSRSIETDIHSIVTSLQTSLTTTPSSSSSSSSPSPPSSNVPEEISKLTTSLLTLKHLSRTLYLHVESTLSEEITKARTDVETRNLALQNLLYERDYLEGEVKEEEERMMMICSDDDADDDDDDDDGKRKKKKKRKKKRECPNLVRVAREELNKEDPNADKIGNTKGGEEEAADDDDDIIDAYLRPPSSSSSSSNSPKYSHRDPKNHEQILSRLRSEIRIRSELEETLRSSLLHLREKKKKVRIKKKFLEELPERIGEVERSTISMQKFFNSGFAGAFGDGDDDDKKKKKKSKNKGSSLWMMNQMGSDRNERIDRALELPGPLYVLFVQLQGYVDAFVGDGGGEMEGIKVDVGSVLDVNKKGGRSTLTKKKKKKWRDDEDDDDEEDDDDGHSQATDEQEQEEGEEASVEELLEPDDSTILLHLPFPEPFSDWNAATSSSSSSASPSSSSFGTITIQFRYLPKLNLVTAGMIRCCSSSPSSSDVIANKIDSKRLLVDLFPGDDGGDLPNASECSFRTDSSVNDEDEGEDGNDKETTEHDESKKNTRIPTSFRTLEKAKRTLSRSSDRPYTWCQYISGILHPPPPPSSQSPQQEQHLAKKRKRITRIEPSTRSVMKQLLRRVRSHTTLSFLIHMLETQSSKKKNSKMWNPIPCHPSLLEENDGNVVVASSSPSSSKGSVGSSGTSAKLIHWVKFPSPTKKDTSQETKENDNDDEDEDPCLYYTATIRRKPSPSLLRASVKIHSSYPATLPIWSLQPHSPPSFEAGGEDEHEGHNRTASSLISSSSSNLYDSTLGQIENIINHPPDMNALVVDSVEASYDWILIHQLRMIVSMWEDVQQQQQQQQQQQRGNSAGGGMWEGERMRRGRDRKVVGFDLYAMGL